MYYVAEQLEALQIEYSAPWRKSPRIGTWGFCGEEPMSLGRFQQILHHIELLALHSNARLTETFNFEVIIFVM
jgi:hypothetical protein